MAQLFSMHTFLMCNNFPIRFSTRQPASLKR